MELLALTVKEAVHPILKTAQLELTGSWKQVLDGVQDQRIRNGLSRFARWASLRRITPAQVDDSAIERFVAELQACTLVRKIDDQQRSVTTAWNRLAGLHLDCPDGVGRIRRGGRVRSGLRFTRSDGG